MKSGEFATHTECDGTDATVISTQTCYIFMSTLTGNDFELVLGNLVVAKVRASNEKGAGLFSPTNIVGALVEEVPLAPSSAPRRGVKTNEVRIGVDWDFLTTYE